MARILLQTPEREIKKLLLRPAQPPMAARIREADWVSIDGQREAAYYPSKATFVLLVDRQSCRLRPVVLQRARIARACVGRLLLEDNDENPGSLPATTSSEIIIAALERDGSVIVTAC